MKLPQPHVIASGARVLIKPWDLIRGSKKVHVEAAEIEFSQDDAGRWFYVRLVYFKDTEDVGYHVSTGTLANGSVTSDTPNTEHLSTICSGTVNDAGTEFSNFGVARVVNNLLEDPDGR